MKPYYILQFKELIGEDWFNVTVNNKKTIEGGRLRVTRAYEIYTEKYKLFKFRIIKKVNKVL